MNNAETQHIFNTSKVTELVNAAIDGWCAKNPNATAEEVLAKRADIATNITASRIKEKFLNSKANRAARRAHIAEEVAKHGLQFTTGSRVIMIPDRFEAPAEFHYRRPFVTALLEELMDMIPLTKPYDQTVTFCFKAEDIGYGIIGAKVAMSFQNPDDDPDSLVAKEYAMARFLNGKVFEATFHKSDIDAIGLHPAIRQSFVQTGVAGMYFDQFVKAQ